MTEQQTQDLSEVESLLATRQQISQWLDKLEVSGSKTPAAVRERVRADYQGRLSQIVEQLRGHSDVISSTLDGLRTQSSEFSELRTEERETLAEAELRYEVGEYAEEEWQRVEADASGKIAELDQELERLSGEISRLEDVLYQITPPPAEPEPEPVVAHAPEPIAAPEPEPEPVRPPPAREEPQLPKAPVEAPEAPRFVARGGRRESGPARTIPFPARDSQPHPSPGREPAAAGQMDELTFLKSMTLDSSRPSQLANAPSAVDSKPERPSQTVPKTLKCGDCGSLNRPTEWYCERCGAELAAV